MNFTWFELNEVDEDKVKYVVIIAKYENELILIRHKNRLIWELPGGKREEGEDIIQTAIRELYEETGSVIFELAPIGTYLLNDSYGMVYYAEVEEIIELPEYEIAESRFSKSLPEGLNYGEVYYRMYEKLMMIKTEELKYIKCDLKINSII